MALPVTISGIATSPACVGPFKTSTVAGNNTGGGNVENLGNNTTLEIGQTFTGAANVTGIKFWLSKTGTPTDNLYAEIRSGSETGTLLGTSDTVAGSGLTTSAQPIYFNFSTPVTGLTIATTYYLLLKRAGSQDVSNYYIADGSTNLYGGGVARRNQSSTWGNAALGDFTFTVEDTNNPSFYFFGKDSTTATTLQAFKATDPTSSWSSIATDTGFSTAVQAVAGVQDGDLIHLAIIDGATTSCNLKYRTFDMSGNIFVLSETVQSGFNPQTSGSANAYGCSICLQNAQPTIHYNGARAASMGSSYSQTYERHRTGVNTWSSAVQVSAGGQVNFTQPEAIAGSSNRAHLLYHNAVPNSSSSLVQRTLNSSYSLQTAATLASMISSQIEAVSYDSSGTQKIVATTKNTTPRISAVYFDSADTVTLNTVVIEAINPPDGWSIFNDQTTAYAVWGLGSDGDLYTESSTDDGASWGSNTNIFAATNGFLSSKDGNIYLRGSDYVIPYIVNDNGTLKYNEYVVRSVSNNKTLVADGGSFIITGTAATPKVARTVTASAGSFAFTGTAASLEYNKKLVSEAGGFLFTGSAASMRRLFALSADNGLFTFTGTAATLARNRPFAVDSGAFVFTGTNTSLTRTRVLVPETGSFLFTGAATTFARTYKLIPDAGSFLYTGTAVTLSKGFTLGAVGGDFVFTGTAATFSRTRKLISEAGSFLFTGTAATLLKGAELTAAGGSFAFTGTAATFARTYKLIPDNGSFLFTGAAASLEHARSLPADSGAFLFTGQDAALSLENVFALPAETGSFLFTGTAASLEHGWELPADGGSFLFTGQDATLALTNVFVLFAETGSFLFTGTAASLAHGWELVPEAGAFVFTGTAANLEANKRLPTEAGSFLFSGTQASLKHGILVFAGSGTFLFTGTAADLIYEEQVATDSSNHNLPFLITTGKLKSF